MKKLIALLLALVMVVGLVACGNANTPAATDAPKADAPATDAPATDAPAADAPAEDAPAADAPAEDIVITWYMPNWSGATMDDLEMVEAAANEIIYAEIGAKLDIQVPNGDFTELMNIKVQSGEEIDIMFSQAWNNEFLNHAKNGAFMDVSGLVEQYAPDILAKSEDYMLACTTVNGALYGFPAQAAYANIRAIALRKDLVDKYNLDVSTIHEVQDLNEYFQTIADNEPDVTPFLGTLTVADANYYCDVPSYGMIYDTPNKEFVMGDIGVQFMVDKYRTFYDWYQKGWTNQNVMTCDWDAEAQSGKYASLEAPTGNYDPTFTRATNTYGYECVEAAMGTTTIACTNVLGGVTCIGATCKNPEKALELLNLVWKNPDLSNMLVYGLEGVHYTVDSNSTEDEKIIVLTDDASKYGLNFYQVGPLWDSWTCGSTTKASLEASQATNKAAYDAMSVEEKALFGFYPDLGELEAEVAAIGAIHSEVMNILMFGTAPDFDEYIADVAERYNEAGMQEVLAEVNRQFQERLNAQ